MHKYLSAILVLLVTLPAIAFIGDTSPGARVSYPPPATGPYAYNGFTPPNTPGYSYQDPVFNETVSRLTIDHDRDDLYGRNMWWSADGRRYLHRTANGGQFADYWNVIDVATGNVTHQGLPIGVSAGDGGFDPVDPNVLYYYGYDGESQIYSIHKITLGAPGVLTDDLYWSTPQGASLKTLGGTLNWLDASGRYMLVRYGPEPSVYLYDRLNMAAGPYANPIDATKYIEAGSYIGITPDGQFLVGYDSSPGAGVYRVGQGVSWRIDHANRTIPATPNVFWSLCGDHGTFVSASDGRNYMVVAACNFEPGIWRADITNNAAGLDEAAQKALPNNMLLLSTTWADSMHMSAMPGGNWAFVSTEDGTDAFNSGTADANGNITPWHAYRQEIIAIEVLTGEIRRLAHHRSRYFSSCPCPNPEPPGVCSLFPDCCACRVSNYYSTPRVSVSWNGEVVGFASNFNQFTGYNSIVDVYAIPFTPTQGGATWVNPINVTVTGGSLRKTSGCDGCGDASANTQEQITSGDGYLEFTASETTTLRLAGLTHDFTPSDYTTIDFGIRLGDFAEVRENGVYKADVGYLSNARFRIAVQGGVIVYSINGAPFYTSTVAPEYPLFGAAVLATLDSTITDAVINGD